MWGGGAGRDSSPPLLLKGDEEEEDGVRGTLTAMALCVAAMAGGCVTDPDTGETSLLGIVPVEVDELAVAEAAANSMAEQGGIVGIIGVAAGAAFGIWRRMKEKNAKAALAAVTTGTAQVLDKLSAVKGENGLSFAAVNQNDAMDILKKAQEDAGVKDKLIDEMLERVKKELNTNA